MNNTWTALFQFLSSPAGQQVVTLGEASAATLVTELLSLFHKHAAQQTATPAAPAAPAPTQGA